MPPEECARARPKSAPAPPSSAWSRWSSSIIPTDSSSTDCGSRSDLARAIRAHRPDVVVTVNFRETWGGRALNMADHRHTGLAVVDAVRDAANPWVFPDAGEAWKGVRMVCVSGSPEPTHAVDVSETIEPGIASLSEHRAYLEHVGGDVEFLREWAAQAGARLGTRYATTFEVYEF